MAWDTRICLIITLLTGIKADGIIASALLPTNHYNQGQVDYLRPPDFVELHGHPGHPGALMATLTPGSQACNGTEPCTIGAMLALFRTLSPQQLTPEQQQMLHNLGDAAEPMRVEPPNFAAVLMPTVGTFYNTSPGMPTALEVRVLTALLLLRFEKPRDDELSSDKWVLDVETDAVRIADMGNKWHPKNSGIWHQKQHIQKELNEALRVDTVASNGNGEIETVAAVMGNVSASEIYAYVHRLRLENGKASKLMGPVRDNRGTSSPRQVVAIPAIAALLRAERHQLRPALKKNRVHVERAGKRTKAEMAEDAEVEIGKLKEMHASEVNSLNKTISNLESEVVSEKGKKEAAQKLKWQAQAQTKVTLERETREKASKKGHTKRVRDECKAKHKEELAAVRATAKEEADEKLKADAKRQHELSTAAHKLKREWKRRAESAEHLAELRQGKLKAMEEVDESYLQESEDEMEVDAATAKLHADAYASVQAMPTWQPTRGAGKGRGAKLFGFDYRVTVYAMFANGTPLSAIGRNIMRVVKATAAWLTPKEPSRRMLSDCRFELRFIEECLGARRAAAAYAIRMLGFDETTKNGNPSITSNVIIEPTKGAVLQPVILRGAYCSAGGTSALIAKAIEEKCFARLRDFLRRWKAKFTEMYPEETWTGPEPGALSLGRLAGGGALQSDTCNTAEKAKSILAEMIAKEAREKIGEEAWGVLTEAEREAATRVHKLDCWQHLRNIFLKEMSAAQAAHVAEELKPHLDAFSTWERMSTEYTQLLRAAYKEFHHGNKYYKGKGREFWVWMKKHYPTAFAIHFERAEGGRQDLDYDAAVPLYVMRPYIVEFLHGVVFGADHSNILEDFIYMAFSSEQFIAMTRANAIIDVRVSRPLRWLSGKSHDMGTWHGNWSPISMGEALDLVEQKFVEASTDGSVLLDQTLDIFAPIAAKSPLFAEHLKYMYEEDTMVAPDNKTKHLIFKLALDELLNPADATNAAAGVRLKTIEYLEVQCVAGLRKMHDPKLAIANKLTSQDGAMSAGKALQAHIDTIGLDATNDRLAESVFGRYDYQLKRNPNISMEAASALAQAMSAKSFEDGGYFHAVPLHEAMALVELARLTVDELRAVDRAHHGEHDAYVEAKRKSNSQLELDALVKEYALAITFYKQWKRSGVENAAAMRLALAALPKEQEKLDYLRLQIEMRVRGLGFVEFRSRMRWSSSKDNDVGTVAELTELLKDILMEEHDLDACDDLPEAAVVPTMRRKTFKELGTPTVQAKEIGSTIKEHSPEELLELAVKKREELEAAGEIDRVADEQPDEPPVRDDSLVASWLEICWARYWRTPTPEEIAKGEKRKKIQVKIWCEGEVMLVANGTTTTENPEKAKCKKLAKAGAVRIRWPADEERDEPEHFSWHILQDADFAPGKDRHLAWRLSASELEKRTQAAVEAEPAHKRRK